MKVVIELIGNESKMDLLATSNYLRELAGEIAPAPVEEPAPLKEPVKTRASRTKKVEEPSPAPIEEPEEVAAPVEEPAPVEEAPKRDAINYSIDDCKQWAMKALNAKKRPLVQEAFEQVGATSFPTLKESMFAEFIEYISTRM